MFPEVVFVSEERGTVARRGHVSKLLNIFCEIMNARYSQSAGSDKRFPRSFTMKKPLRRISHLLEMDESLKEAGSVSSLLYS